MSSSSPCAAHAAARVVHVPASITALFLPHVGWRARARASATNNNELMPNNNNSSMALTYSTMGTSISMLTADNIPTHNINGVLESSGNDVDFVKAGRGGGFDHEISGGEGSGGEEGRQGEEHGEEPLE